MGIGHGPSKDLVKFIIMIKSSFHATRLPCFIIISLYVGLKYLVLIHNKRDKTNIRRSINNREKGERLVTERGYMSLWIQVSYGSNYARGIKNMRDKAQMIYHHKNFCACIVHTSKYIMGNLRISFLVK